MVSSLTASTSGLILLIRFVREVFPLVDRELACWQDYAATHGMRELSEQALASIHAKKFHCQGGSVYSLYKGIPTGDFVRLVVALQTISDYLDNLCDRAGIADEAAFRQLHLAMTDALDPDRPISDYYAAYPYKDDGGYLPALVTTCRREIAKLPSYRLVKPEALRQAGLYSELQTYKHLDPLVREQKMLTWINPHLLHYPGITAWEFAAATGSTLGLFMLCAAAHKPNLTASEAETIGHAYFPWINGLHILLDYFIDEAEDRQGGDLNFVSYYGSSQEILSRLTLFVHQARSQANSLPETAFVRTVVDGLLAMYLSDPKTAPPTERAIRDSLLHSAGWYPRLMYGLCRLLRKRHML
ncbi:Tetraprenyl-beta-curcumene synthase [Sporomusa silvacetica DSM 10669]|uniref:Tetraprenyl-beta-curcumene synthase n=1 Tax=Sporomusa silvacetica DSM 10669 TaxID=1123289 RepID=A0ABZ3IUB3_9FIRM|nr:tetraprenyl-beta-curcumene synthase family protein [Sporomusa silvacetica]OZC21133.1 tetraprenyl-beta-curcumene synthase [Sporomusa silvacetica DSM 10669]